MVLLQMVGDIFVGESPNPTIAFARELHLGVKPSKTSRRTLLVGTSFVDPSDFDHV